MVNNYFLYICKEMAAAAGQLERVMTREELKQQLRQLSQTAFNLEIFTKEEIDDIIDVIESDDFSIDDIIDDIEAIKGYIRDEGYKEDKERRFTDDSQKERDLQLENERIQDVKIDGAEDDRGNDYSPQELIQAGLKFPLTNNLNQDHIDRFFHNLELAVHRIYAFKNGIAFDPEQFGVMQEYDAGYKRGGFIQPTRKSHRVGRMK